MNKILNSREFQEAGNLALKEYGAAVKTPELLWHYTNAAGLKGIVDSKSLWFTEAMFMNDGSEVSYGLALLHECLLEATQKFDIPGADTLKNQLFDQARAILNAEGMIICCFCDDGNLLNQWRDYGKDIVSYSIAFDAKSLVEKYAFTFGVYIIKVIYERDRQKKIMLRTLQMLLEKAREIPGYGSLSDEEAAPYIAQAALQLAYLVLWCKDPAFAAEQEWRLVSHRPQVAKRGRMAFRQSPLGIIPYHSWEPQNNPKLLPIRKARVGPSPYSKVSLLGLKVFLQESGYPDVDCDTSEIAIRRFS